MHFICSTHLCLIALRLIKITVKPFLAVVTSRVVTAWRTSLSILSIARSHLWASVWRSCHWNCMQWHPLGCWVCECIFHVRCVQRLCIDHPQWTWWVTAGLSSLFPQVVHSGNRTLRSENIPSVLTQCTAASLITLLSDDGNRGSLQNIWLRLHSHMSDNLRRCRCTKFISL